jgi:hypothetical protein
MSKNICFFAYPAMPAAIGTVIEASIKELNALDQDREIRSWRELDIPGHFIATEILESIDNAEILIADVTRLNFNVTYEVAYAIGKSKRVVLVKNKSISTIKPSIADVGIFDTIGYFEYQNANQLTAYLKAIGPERPLDINYDKNSKLPVYLNEAKYKNDWVTTLVSRVKKARLGYRTFDPNEQPRLSAHEAIKQVAQSYGVLVHLLGDMYDEHEKHNIWASFIAGLANGMDKVLVIVQSGLDPVPIDYRDFVESFQYPQDIFEIVNDFAASVTEAWQSAYAPVIKEHATFLERLELGASSAENELKSLGGYYLETDEFRRAARGEIRVVVGRKGSGKTAIFFQIRDKERESKKNIVLDLKPDGYKLLKFKEHVIRLLTDGSFEHTIMIFWEYVLLLELCRKILITDSKYYMHDHNLTEPYRRLQEILKSEPYFTEGDFSERLSNLIQRIASDYTTKYGNKSSTTLSDPQITELVYNKDIVRFKEELFNYLSNKESVWILIDNLDKGWPTHGIEPRDLVIIRTLQDATRKVERLFRKKLDVYTIIFLRNDVYELLVEETPDRGKETKAVIDWTDPDMLRELIRKRVVYNGIDPKKAFKEIWPSICVSHFCGEESSQFLIDRTLMRPRFLINLINQCKGFAVNLKHEKIQNDDIEKGLFAYSNDIITEISLEIRDVYPAAEDIIYEFIGSDKKISEKKLVEIINNKTKEPVITYDIVKMLIWYSFLGIHNGEKEPIFIYNTNYNYKLISAIIDRKRISGELMFAINPAFWPTLYIA